MLALLYDVHGNLPALEAVLAHADADRYLFGGDYVAFGGWPLECQELLQGLEHATWIRGNTDRWLTEPPDGGPTEALRMARALGADATWLHALPETVSLDEGLFCHASPLNDMESFAPEAQDDEDRLLDGVHSGRVVFGHTHVQFRRVRDDGIELINPGSVGMPLDGDHRSAYALIGEDSEVELRRVAYDHELAARVVEEVLGDAGEVYAQRLRTARP